MYSLEKGQTIEIQYLDKGVGSCNKRRRDEIHALDNRDGLDTVITEVGFAFYRDALIHVGQIDRDYAQKNTRELYNRCTDGNPRERIQALELVKGTVTAFFGVAPQVAEIRAGARNPAPVTVFARNR